MGKGIREYFSYPPTGGFSPYRTGMATHYMLFMLLGAGTIKGLVTWTGCPLAAAALIAGIAMVLLWGVGVLIGIASHYNLLITLATFGGFIGTVIAFPTVMGKPIAVSFGVNVLVFALMKIVSWAINNEKE